VFADAEIDVEEELCWRCAHDDAPTDKATCSTSPRLRGEVGFRAKRSEAMESGCGGASASPSVGKHSPPRPASPPPRPPSITDLPSPRRQGMRARTRT